MSADANANANQNSGPEDDEVEISEEAQEKVEQAAEENEEPSPDQSSGEASDDAAVLKDQLLRALADAENTRRRAEKDRKEAGMYATTALARDLISVIDNMARALEALPEEAKGDDSPMKNFVVGIEMTQKELLSAFEKHGIQRIEAEGELFDYNIHQAVSEVPNTGQPNGTVVQQMQAGYKIHDRLLRPAMVIVAKGDDAPSGDDAETGIDTTA